MAKPNKTVAAWRRKVGRDPKAIEATNKRMEASPMVADMKLFQEGKMTAEEFTLKWENKS